jgi:hypothetical protein
MTTRSLLRLCAAFVGATGLGLIANPGFVERELFGGLAYERVSESKTRRANQH